MAIIEPLVTADIPEAKYWLGWACLYGFSDVPGVEYGVTLLEEAAAAGNSKAMAKLGDYYFGQGPEAWGKAFACYTGMGALGLSDFSKNSLTQILNQKAFNAKTLKLSGVLLVAMALFVVLAPGVPAVPACRALGIVCLIAAGIFFAISVMHFRTKPYGSFAQVPTGITLAWTLLVVARLFS